MLTSRRIIPITIAILYFLPGLVLGQAVTGDDFKELIPDESEKFTLEQVEPREDAALVKAVYVYNPLDVEIPFFLAYNNDSEKVKEYSTDYYSSEGFTYGADNSDLEKKLDEGESSYSVQMDLQQGLGKKILSWEMKHGTLRDEYPITQLLPPNADPFVLSNIRNKTASSLVYASYDHPEMEQSVEIRLYHGERAQQEYELAKCEWDDKESIQFGDETFYGTASESGMSITSYLDNFFIDLVLQDRTDDPDAQQIEQQMEKFVESFGINRLSDWNAPEPKVSDLRLSEKYFADILPKDTDNFVLQNIESKEGALLKANYLFKPEEHEITLNLVYKEGAEQLGDPKQTVGNFRVNVIPNCLENKTSDKNPRQFFNELYDNIDESGLAKWEIDHANLQEVNPLAAYFPKNLKDFSISSIRPDDEDLTVNAKYQESNKEDPINVMVTYGDDAARKYNQLQLNLFENEPTEMEIDNTTFNVLEMDDEIIAFKYNDHLLITAGYSDISRENKEDLYQQLANFLTSFQPNKLANFEAPEDYEMDFTGEQDGTKLCLGLDCFDEQISKCEPAKFGGRLQYRLGVMYEVEEPSGDNQCQLSFEYTRNPNSDLEEQPLYFLMNREDSFLESGRDIIEDCLEGNTELCEGPLLDAISEGE